MLDNEAWAVPELVTDSGSVRYAEEIPRGPFGNLDEFSFETREENLTRVSFDVHDYGLRQAWAKARVPTRNPNDPARDLQLCINFKANALALIVFRRRWPD